MAMLCDLFKHMTVVSVLGQDSSQVVMIKSQEFAQQEEALHLWTSTQFNFCFS
jgi:hypothetical protein